MNRNEICPSFSCRMASRRLRRRSAYSANMGYFVSSVAASSPAMTFKFTGGGQYEPADFGLFAASLRIAELEKQLADARHEACLDPLTGALNRRGFERVGALEMARMSRTGGELALAHIDLDDFKSLNDTFGHQAGDQALIHLVRLLLRSKRPSDILCRMGGEEFVMLLPDTGLEQARVALLRFLTEFSSSPLPSTDRQMTFSAGIAVCLENETLADVLRRADAAMYDAKNLGKNRIQAV